jgi:hypothetical protein
MCCTQDVRAQQGRSAIVAEVRRAKDISSPQELAEAARRVLAAGADAVAVPTDLEDTPSGDREEIVAAHCAHTVVHHLL